MRFTPVAACHNLLSFAISCANQGVEPQACRPQTTGKVARRVRAALQSPTMGAADASRRLAHIPEERQRALRDAVDLAAPRLVGKEKPGRRIDDVLERGLIEPGDRGLFLLEI